MKGGGNCRLDSRVYRHCTAVQLSAAHQFLPTDRPTLPSYLHPGWLLDGAGRDDDPHPPVAVAGHGAAPGVHQEADQEAGAGGRQRPRHGLGHLAAVERGARGGARGAEVQCSAVQGTEEYLGSGSRPVQHGEHFLALPAIPAQNTLLLAGATRNFLPNKLFKTN